MNLSLSQQNSIEFYELNESFVNSYGTAGMERSERRMYNEGKKLSTLIIAEAIKIAAPGTTRNPWSDDEVQFLLDHYMVNSDSKILIELFFEMYPQTEHSVGSVDRKICRIRVLDRQFDGNTKWQSDNQVRRICSQYPNRFEVWDTNNKRGYSTPFFIT